jgi:hypothetical protein
LFTEQPANAASPLAAALGLAVQVNDALPGVVKTRVTEAVLVVTVLPAASCTVTTGCVAIVVPPVPPLGCVVNASLVAAPGVIVKVVLVAEASDPLVAVSV